MASIYITYAHGNEDDRALAQDIYKTLTSSGHSVIYWHDAPYDWEVITKVIQDADKVIVIFSRESYASYECYLEISASLTEKRRSFPFLWRLDDIPTRKIIPINYREKDVPSMEAIMSLVVSSDWKTIDTIQDTISQIRNEINRYDWINLNDYYLETNTNKRKLALSIARQELINAVVSIYPTWRAFLSYARHDNKFVEPFRQKIEDTIPIWFDKKAIASGKDWQEEIYRGIDKSHNFLFVVSIASLTSPNCRREYDHAIDRNKRIFPIIYQNFDEKKCRDYLKNKPWHDGEDYLSDDIAIEKALEVWNAINELPKWQVHHVSSKRDITKRPSLVPRHGDLRVRHAISKKNITQLVTALLDGFEKEREYINQHTLWLLRARNYDDGEGKLLGLRQWWEANRWLKSSNKPAQQHPPTIIHKRYIRQSMIYWRNVFASLIAILCAVILVILILMVRASRAEIAQQEAEALQLVEQRNAADARAQTETIQRNAAEQRAADAIERLQLQTIYNETLRYELDQQHISDPILEFNAIWLPQADGILRQPINGLEEPTKLSVGRNPDSIIVEHDFLWVNNRGQNTLTRIDPLDNTSLVTTVGISPHPPLFTDNPNSVWIQTQRHLTRFDIDLKEQSSYLIGLNNHIAFSTSQAIWYLSSSRDQLKVIDETMDTPHTISLVQPGYQAIYHEGSQQVFVVSDQQISVINPTTQSIEKTIDLYKPIQGLLIDDTYLWGILNDQSGFIRLDPITYKLLRVEQTGVSTLYPANDHIWSITDDTLTLYQSEPIELISTIDSIPNVRQIQIPSSDGKRTWFTHPHNGQVYVIDEKSGSIIRDFALCTQSSVGIYDNAMMWFACSKDQTLLAVPADIYFLGERIISDDGQPHQPIVINDVLWLTQPTTGRIITFDLKSEQVIKVFDIGKNILPLIEDSPYLWTATVGSGDVLRIDTRNLTPIGDENAIIETQTLDLNISNLTLLGDNLWVQQFEQSESTFLKIIDRSTFTLREDTVTDRLLAAGTLYNDAIWSSIFDLQDSYIVKANPETAEIIYQEKMPQTRFASTPPLLYNELLWFTAVLPPPILIPTITAQLERDNQDSQLPFYFLGINPITNQAEKIIKLPIWTHPPKMQDQVAWFRIAVGNNYIGINKDQPSAGIIAINIDTSEIIGSWRICDYDSSIYIVGDYAWIGCQEFDDKFGIISGQQADFIQFYDAIGQSPNPPIQYKDHVIFTFSNSNTLAIFNVNTGELKYTMKTGNNPQSPIVYNNILWIYNSWSDTLQRIDLKILGDS